MESFPMKANWFRRRKRDITVKISDIEETVQFDRPLEKVEPKSFFVYVPLTTLSLH